MKPTSQRPQLLFILPALFVALVLSGCATAGASSGLPSRVLDACKGGDGDACMRIAQAYENKGERASEADFAQKACELGDLEGCAVVADRLARGDKPDPEKALAPAQKACDGKVMRGCSALSSANYQLQRYKAAYEAAEAGCSLGDGSACLEAGLNLSYRAPEVWTRTSDMADAVKRQLELLADACQRGFGQGCHKLSELYGTGKFVSRDVEASLWLAYKGCQGHFEYACSRAMDLQRSGPKQKLTPASMKGLGPPPPQLWGLVGTPLPAAELAVVLPKGKASWRPYQEAASTGMNVLELVHPTEQALAAIYNVKKSLPSCAHVFASSAGGSIERAPSSWPGYAPFVKRTPEPDGSTVHTRWCGETTNGTILVEVSSPAELSPETLGPLLAAVKRAARQVSGEPRTKGEVHGVAVPSGWKIFGKDGFVRVDAAAPMVMLRLDRAKANCEAELVGRAALFQLKAAPAPPGLKHYHPAGAEGGAEPIRTTLLCAPSARGGALVVAAQTLMAQPLDEALLRVLDELAVAAQSSAGDELAAAGAP